MTLGVRQTCVLAANALLALCLPRVRPKAVRPAQRPDGHELEFEAELLPASTSSAELVIPSNGALWGGVAEADLKRISRKKTAQARLVARARMVLGVVFGRRPLATVARELGVARATVRLWVSRFQQDGTIKALEDLPRSGRPARLGVREQAVVMGLACQRPEDLGRLEGRMTQPIIVEEAAKQGVNLSRSSVQRILALAEVKPHRERYYLFTVKDQPEYIARRDAICAAYTRDYPEDEVLICMDEKTGIQALGLPRKLPHGGRRPAAPGIPARIDQHYVRHGSRSLVVAVRPDTGRLAHAAVFPSRGFKSAEAIGFLREVAEALPFARVIHVIWDNGATHTSRAMKAFLASEEGRRFRVLYTPPHASWLDLAENFFSRFSRRYLHGKRYTSLQHLDDHLKAALDDYDRVARPMRWTYAPQERAAA